jgi:hypothetical protein
MPNSRYGATTRSSVWTTFSSPPHAAGLMQESARRMSEGAATQVLQLIAGERPDFLVNLEIWEKHLERLRIMKGARQWAQTRKSDWWKPSLPHFR